MWSDRASPERLRELVSGLQSVLPAPSADARSRTTILRGAPNVEQVAALLHSEAGFAWVRGSDGPCLLRQPLVTVSYAAGRAAISGPGGSIGLEARAFDLLEAMLEAWRGPSEARTGPARVREWESGSFWPDAPGSVVRPNSSKALLAGFLAYDLASELEDLGSAPAETFEFPSLYFGLYDSSLVFDGQSWRLISTNAWREPLSISDADALLSRAEAASPRVDEPPLAKSPLTSRPDACSFAAAVDRIVRTIHAGDIFQTNLCRSIEAGLAHGEEWNLFRRLRSISPSHYEAFLRIDAQHSILSISPEMFLQLEGGAAESAPIKGTRARGHDPQEDRELAADLVASEKDRAELAMIVDVVRNDLARVCEPGSVKVVKHAEFMSLPTVHHLFSTVRGRLRDDAGAADLLRAAFPAASITGAPKIEAMRLAMREEGQRRGPAMGAIGWISLDGRMELSVAIRTAFVTGGRARYYAGCGITSDSVARAELEESRHKAAAFARALAMERDPNW